VVRHHDLHKRLVYPRGLRGADWVVGTILPAASNGTPLIVWRCG
jgi:hypothetical protein